MTERSRARALADEAAEEDPTGWFETLYAEAVAGDAVVPWADREPNPNLVEWLDARGDAHGSPDGPGDDAGPRRADASALVVGCGLGDDVEELASRGWDATGFDVSPTAIDWARRRFPDSDATFAVADLFDPPAAWAGAFDLVVESYTLQALPSPDRTRAVPAIADFVGPGGSLVVIARGREPDEDPGSIPWPLTRAEVEGFAAAGLRLASFDDYLDGESPPVRRFRATFDRPRR